jgi:uncharacterized protein YegP (UPF0339 family)
MWLFSCFLIAANTHIVSGSEVYTSKQCGKCGYLNDKLGGS